jgi:magnesium transporter
MAAARPSSFALDMLVLTQIDRARIAAELERDAFFWLDLRHPAPADIDALGELLGLHPVAIEDTREFGQRPKVDVYDDTALIVFYSARRRDDTVDPVEVHVYVSGRFAVTVARDECAMLDALHEDLEPQGTEDEVYLVYRIFDSLTDAYYPVIEGLEARVDGLEREVLTRPRRDQLTTIYRTRQDVRGLQRLTATQRDQFKAAMDPIAALPGLQRGSHPYLRDVTDHLAQIAGELQRQNEDLAALTATYFNANSDRLNAVATRLTILGTLFVMWTLVTGFFGQNFGWLVAHIDSQRAFLLYGLGGLVVPTAVLLSVFWAKRRDWF